MIRQRWQQKSDNDNDKTREQEQQKATISLIHGLGSAAASPCRPCHGEVNVFLGVCPLHPITWSSVRLLNFLSLSTALSREAFDWLLWRVVMPTPDESCHIGLLLAEGLTALRVVVFRWEFVSVRIGNPARDFLGLLGWGEVECPFFNLPMLTVSAQFSRS